MNDETLPLYTPVMVAQWMVEQLETDGVLSQPQAAADIQALFGDEFVYLDPFGNLAISRKVLYQFRKRTVDSAVWEVTNGNYFDGRWRLRLFGDTPWRRQSVSSK